MPGLERVTVHAVKEAQRRIHWLENELSRVLGMDCKTVPTGTSLEVAQGKDEGLLHGHTPDTSQDSHNRSRTQDLSSIATNPSSNRNDDDAPEMGLLALNATGESRYLGPSSGAAFATSAIALVQSCSRQQPAGRQQHSGSSAVRELSNNATDDRHISPDEVQLLLQSYKLWVHPVYALFDLESLDDLIMKCSAAQSHNVVGSLGQEMSIFYVIMALGATNRPNAVKQLQTDPRKLSPSEKAPSPAELFTKASQHFQFSMEHLRPSVMFIKALLLICIYCFYHPVGSSQWQLAGMAMRTAVEIGLHYVPKLNQVSTRDIDERSRVFWTAYAIEITLSYNLGRPPSIGEEHITSRLPADTSEAASSAIHHIKHRQIQSRIISQVYYGKMHDVTPSQRENIIADLQSELDQWRDALRSVCLQDKDTAYPYQYVKDVETVHATF
ncbi:fungal specific transcription factor domain-containing protein [Pochonia chlamydosporia 170]|uniref:Fungal specific transcription factor domain-containing protein n=1 Tax=Pochonia chlamydosporia 170 TaxID=1380566 RepID=A0A179F1W9_METCM|nr:fungal specific transcription factor domain-containing protein [Pochonia chlamydosporia 170]OAQ59428.2 fungal specific transcription factor domain-containing protein [Pochonia chlamydosporia 170]